MYEEKFVTVIITIKVDPPRIFHFKGALVAYRSIVKFYRNNQKSGPRKKYNFNDFLTKINEARVSLKPSRE